MQMQDLNIIKEIVIENPPTYYEVVKKKQSALLGKKVSVKYYLTANLFFNNGTSFHTISKIVNETKLFLKEKIGYLPELEKMRLEIIIRSPKHIDLDNRAYFWKKIFLDILKTPTEKQLQNAILKNKIIITTNTIKDDDTKVIDDIRERFIYGGNSITFIVFGRLKDEQKTIKF